MIGPGLHALDESEYFADPCDAPSLSASIARTLLDRSPLHAYHEHPRLGGNRRAPTKEMDRGSLVHKLVLGAGAELVIVDAKDWRTKLAQEERDAARDDGKIPVLIGAHDDAVAAAFEITKRLGDLGVELAGSSEVSLVWEDASATGKVWARGRLDHLEGATISDLKTCRSAHPRACAKHVIDYGYDIQRAAYVRGLERVRPDLAGRVDFRFLFVEPEPPYAVVVARLDGVLRERGERRWEQAIARWALCLRRGSWPAYADEPVILESPGWLLAEMRNDEMDEVA